MSNVIDITPQINEKIIIDNGIRIHRKQVDQLAALGMAITQQPLKYFEQNPYSAKDNKSNYLDWALEFQSGRDTDFKGINTLINQAKKTLLSSMRFGSKLIMPDFKLRSFNGSSVEGKETLYQFTTEDGSVVEFSMNTLRELLKHFKTNNTSGAYDHQIEIIEDLWQTN